MYIISKGQYMNKNRKIEYIVFGIILVVIGAIFLVNNFYPDLRIWSNLIKLWPIILIIYGIKKIFSAIGEGVKNHEI